MGYKVTASMMLKIQKTLTKSADAINNLERRNNNRIIYSDLKQELHKLNDELESRYHLKEFTDPSARDNMLEENRKQAELTLERKKRPA